MLLWILLGIGIGIIALAYLSDRIWKDRLRPPHAATGISADNLYTESGPKEGDRLTSEATLNSSTKEPDERRRRMRMRF